ncbi:peptidoglycan-binding domain-containing protein [Acrocarpospora sp. B8E8]|uniref:peptidoglycan-binding domain-containing protein n=1 Tax=Acrocarpospora sp. B8E8 TaxID=3153572 RepID=UPI00325EF0F9
MLVTLLLALAGALAISSPAAAWVYCNSVSLVQGGYDAETVIVYPTYNDNSTNCDMRINEHGTTGQREAISQLQHNINVCYGPNRWDQGTPHVTNHLTVDGEYGPQTYAAIKAVQRHLNDPAVQVDGYAGPQTRSRMHHPSVEGYCIMPATVPYPAIVSP